MTDDLREVLAGPVLEVAPRLLGAVLRHGDVAVRLTEVEAYAGADDPGSHAYRGPTPRTRVMFGPPAHLYVYFVYGMHHCANVVCGPAGEASAVLLRAGEVLPAGDHALARGPAKLCRALGLDLALTGADLVAGPVTLELGPPVPEHRIATGPRVGLRHASQRPWRFWVEGEPSVSRYVAAKPRTARAPVRAPRPGDGG